MRFVVWAWLQAVWAMALFFLWAYLLGAAILGFWDCLYGAALWWKLLLTWAVTSPFLYANFYFAGRLKAAIVHALDRTRLQRVLNRMRQSVFDPECSGVKFGMKLSRADFWMLQSRWNQSLEGYDYPHRWERELDPETDEVTMRLMSLRGLAATDETEKTDV